MDIDAAQIYSTVKNIINDLEAMTLPELNEKYKDFKEKFFKLYIMCTEVTPETKDKTLYELGILLNIRDSVIDGSKDSIMANVQVSEYMAKQYVYPITGEPSLDQKKTAFQKILRGETKKNGQ
jgi:hypothetical protein